MEDEKKDKSSNRENTLNQIRLDFKISEILQTKKPLFERKFDESFRLVTTSVEFKNGVFFQRVKLIIEANRLLCYPYNSENVEDPNEINQPLCVLDFNQVTAGIAINAKQNKFRVMVLGFPNGFKFKTSSKEIFENILIHLNHFIQTSLGKKSNLLGVSLRADFHKMYFMFEREFAEKARTGDLLIFRGFECPARCQRMFTGAHYDHVALLVRRNEQVFVYESTSKDVFII
jgi:hypothetical protein